MTESSSLHSHLMPDDYKGGPIGEIEQEDDKFGFDDNTYK